MGPTASGKTELAIRLSSLLPVEIISVDSTQVYCDLDIGSGKPDSAVLRKTPHHLIDILPPDQVYSAAQFKSDAVQLIHQIHEKGKIPLLVGGTMMYFHVLQNGLHTLPESDSATRAMLEADGEALGWAAMHERLRQIDSDSAARINLGDKQRIQRALEVYYVTQKTLSEHLKSQKVKSDFNFINFALIPKETARCVLHDRINSRFLAMLKDGFVDEVIGLREKYKLHQDLPSMRSVGYRQVWAYLEHQVDYETMQVKAMAATRQLAKRQLTWLRRWPDLIEIDLLAETKTDILIDAIAPRLYALHK